MGADFLLIAIRNNHHSQDELDRRVDALSDEKLAEVYYDKTGEDAPTPDEVASGVEWESIDGNPTENTWQNDVRLYLKRCVAEVFFANHRDIVQLNLDGTDWLFSGGMSWGDDPSEGFRPMSSLEIAQIA